MSATCGYGSGSCPPPSTGPGPTTPVVTVPPKDTTPNELAFTGGDVVGLLILVAVLIAAGMAMVGPANRWLLAHVFGKEVDGDR